MAGKERKILSKDSILTADDLPTEEVEVEEWGGSILIRTLTGRERDQLEANMLVGKNGDAIDLENVRARLVVAAAVDGEGKPLFQPADIAKLGEKSSAALSKAAAVAQRLSGMSTDDIKDLAKNSSGGPAD